MSVCVSVPAPGSRVSGYLYLVMIQNTLDMGIRNWLQMDINQTIRVDNIHHTEQLPATNRIIGSSRVSVFQPLIFRFGSLLWAKFINFCKTDLWHCLELWTLQLTDFVQGVVLLILLELSTIWWQNNWLLQWIQMTKYRCTDKIWINSSFNDYFPQLN